MVTGFDTHKNLAISTVLTAPVTPTAGTSLVLAAGEGVRFPDPATFGAYNATIWPTGQFPTPANAEIVRITAKSTDTLTITRAQEGTVARTVAVGDLIAVSITVKTLEDVETAINARFEKANGTLTTGAAPTYADGKLVYNSDTRALRFFNNDTTVGLDIGQEQWVEVKNTTGSTITAGQVVYSNGSSTNTGGLPIPTVGLAVGSSFASSQVLGIVTTTSIPNNGFGFVTAHGIVHNLNTTGLTAGLPIYLHPSTPGAFTQGAPNNNTDFRVRIGNVVSVNGSTGTVLVQLSDDAVNVASTTAAGLMTSSDKIQMNGMYYDIVADGGADPTGSTDATTIINSAITTVSAAGGGVVFFPTGTYKVNTAGTAIALSGNYVTLRGQGAVASAISSNHATSNCIEVTGNNCRIEHLRIIGSSSTIKTAGFGIVSNPANATVNTAVVPSVAQNLFVDNVSIIYMWSGIQLSGQTPRLNYVVIRECGRNAINGAGILIPTYIDAYINNIEMDNGNGVGGVPNSAGHAGIRITNLSSLLLQTAQVIHCTNGLDIVPNATNTVPSIAGMNCFFDNCTIAGNFVSATGTIARSTFVKCWFSSSGTAGVILNNPNLNGVEFVACEFYGNATHGIDAISFVDFSVRSSRIAGNTTTGVRTAAISGSRFAINDNTIGTCGGFGLNGLGINVQAGTYTAYQILDNRQLDSNSTPGITDSGSVVATGAKNVNNNLGTIAGALIPLASGGGSVLANSGRGAAISSPTTEAVLATFRIPPNSVAVGDIFELFAIVQCSGVTGNLTPRVRVGTGGTTADALINHSAGSLTGAINGYFLLKCYVEIIALGPTATVATVWNAVAPAGTTVIGPTAAETIGNVITTAQWFVSLCAVHSASTATVRSIKMTKIN